MENVHKYNNDILIGETRRQVWLVGVMIVNSTSKSTQTHTHTQFVDSYFSHSLCNVIATIFPMNSSTVSYTINNINTYNITDCNFKINNLTNDKKWIRNAVVQSVVAFHLIN